MKKKTFTQLQKEYEKAIDKWSKKRLEEQLALKEVDEINDKLIKRMFEELKKSEK